MSTEDVRGAERGLSRRGFLRLGAAAGLAVVTVGKGRIDVSAAESGGTDPGSGRQWDPGDGARAPSPDAYVIPVILGTEMLTRSFSTFTACADTGGTLYYVRESNIGRAVVYCPTGWVHALLPIPGGSRIWRIDVFGRRATYGTQYWKLQAAPLLDLGIADPVADVLTCSIPATTGTTHGVMAPTTPIAVQLGFGYTLTLTGTDANNQAGGFIVQYTPSWLGGMSPNNGTGVIGGSGADKLPLAPPKTGVYGYAAQDGYARGVVGESTVGYGVYGRVTSGRGVRGYATTGTGGFFSTRSAAEGIALRAVGRVRLDKCAGVAYVAAGSSSVRVSPGVKLHSRTAVVATLQANPGGSTTVQRVVVEAARKRFTIYLTGRARRRVKVAWHLFG